MHSVWYVSGLEALLSTAEAAESRGSHVILYPTGRFADRFKGLLRVCTILSVLTVF